MVAHRAVLAVAWSSLQPPAQDVQLASPGARIHASAREQVVYSQLGAARAGCLQARETSFSYLLPHAWHGAATLRHQSIA